jgi:hypothetical protein
MRLKAGANEYLEYKYVLKADDYMLDFDSITMRFIEYLSH